MVVRVLCSILCWDLKALRGKQKIALLPLARLLLPTAHLAGGSRTTRAPVPRMICSATAHSMDDSHRKLVERRTTVNTRNTLMCTSLHGSTA